MGLDSNKIPYPDSPEIKCPKCGHVFKCDPGWIKAAITMGCPKCGELIRIRKPVVE